MAFGDDFYKSVEIAVNATGAQGVQQLEARVQALQAQMVAYQQALASGAPINQKALDGLESLSAKLAEASEAAAAGQRVLAGMPAKLGDVGRGGQAAARGVLELSRGLEDLTTGGFLGILNNIPGTIGNFGQAAKLSATQVAILTSAASGLGTAAYLIYQNWDKIKKLFDDGLSPKLIDDVESVTAKLKELTEKEWKTRVDVRDIQIAKGELDQLTKAKRGYDALNAPTQEEKDRGAAVQQAVIEGGGRPKIEEAIIAATTGQVSPEVKAVQAKMDQLDQRIKEVDVALAKAEASGNVDQVEGLTARRGMLAGDRSKLADSKEGQLAAQDQNRRAAVQQQLGLAGAGDLNQLRSLMDIISKRPQKFAAQGLNPQALLKALFEATPEGVARNKAIDEDYESSIAGTDLSIGRVKDFFKGIRKQEKETDSERKQRTGQDVARVGPGVDDQLQKTLFDAIKGGATPEAAMGRQRSGLIRTLRGRNVSEDVVSDVAGAILQKAAEQAQNLIAEGKKPTIDVKADAEWQKMQRDAAQDNQRRSAEGLAEIRKVGGDLAPSYIPTIQRMLAENQLQQAQGGGLGDEELIGQLRGMISGSLRQQGAPDVSSEIIRRGIEEFNKVNMQNMAVAGNGIAGLIATLNDAIADQQRAGAQLRALFGNANQGAVRGRSLIPRGG